MHDHVDCERFVLAPTPTRWFVPSSGVWEVVKKKGENVFEGDTCCCVEGPAHPTGRNDREETYGYWEMFQHDRQACSPGLRTMLLPKVNVKASGMGEHRAIWGEFALLSRAQEVLKDSSRTDYTTFALCLHALGPPLARPFLCT